MEAIIKESDSVKNQYLEKIYFGDDEIVRDIKIIDYMEITEPGKLIITLFSEQFLNNTIKVTVRNQRIIINVSEFVGPKRNSFTHGSDWEKYGRHSYTRIHNISIFLPGDNFYIIRHLLVPEKSYLQIVLGQDVEN